MNNKTIKNTIVISLLCIFSLTAVILLPSASKIMEAEESLASKNLSDDIKNSVLSINDQVNAEIFNLPKVYTLPMDFSAAPKPDPANYTEDTYQDDTISVKCWKERIKVGKYTITANFAEVKIAHPTQLRTALAGGKYGTSKRIHASKMAAANNAVLAVNADFYNCRTDGLIIRQGTLYRSKPFNIDTLFIDSDGNLTVMRDRDAVKNGFIKNNKIYQAIAFGPLLVEDGKAVKKSGTYNSVDCDPRAKAPRTGIGQLGKLHYLLCTIDGRSEESIGVTTNDFADIMASKNCTIAYNLDGGQSSVMVLNNKVYNVVSGGGERVMSDILYFASAVPESEWS